MPEASSVTFDVLLGGKVAPQVLKAFKDLEDEGAYKETFKLETEGKEATISFLDSLGCSDVERVLLLLG
jgi:hypothetical protein